MSDRIVNEHLMSQMPEGHKLENGLIVPGSALPPVSPPWEQELRNILTQKHLPQGDGSWLLLLVSEALLEIGRLRAALRAGPPGEPELTDAQYLVAITAAYEAIDTLAIGAGLDVDSDPVALSRQLFTTGFTAALRAIDGRGTATPE